MKLIFRKAAGSYGHFLGNSRKSLLKKHFRMNAPSDQVKRLKIETKGCKIQQEVLRWVLRTSNFINPLQPNVPFPFLYRKS